MAKNHALNIGCTFPKNSKPYFLGFPLKLILTSKVLWKALLSSAKPFQKSMMLMSVKVVKSKKMALQRLVTSYPVTFVIK